MMVADELLVLEKECPHMSQTIGRRFFVQLQENTKKVIIVV